MLKVLSPALYLPVLELALSLFQGDEQVIKESNHISTVSAGGNGSLWRGEKKTCSSYLLGP